MGGRRVLAWSSVALVAATVGVGAGHYLGSHGRARPKPSLLIGVTAGPKVTVTVPRSETETVTVTSTSTVTTAVTAPS